MNLFHNKKRSSSPFDLPRGISNMAFVSISANNRVCSNMHPVFMGNVVKIGAILFIILQNELQFYPILHLETNEGRPEGLLCCTFLIKDYCGRKKSYSSARNILFGKTHLSISWSPWMDFLYLNGFYFAPH